MEGLFSSGSNSTEQSKNFKKVDDLLIMSLK